MASKAATARNNADMESGRITTGIDSRGRHGRAFLHVLIGIASWLAFVYLWIWKIQYEPWLNTDLVWSMIALGFLVFLIGGIIWVRWNRFLYWRNDRNKKEIPPVIDTDFNHDTLGRKIDAAPIGDLRREPVVVVDIDQKSGIKRFTGASTSDAERQPSTPEDPTAKSRPGLLHIGLGPEVVPSAGAGPAPETTCPAGPVVADQPDRTPQPSLDHALRVAHSMGQTTPSPAPATEDAPVPPAPAPVIVPTSTAPPSTPAPASRPAAAPVAVIGESLAPAPAQAYQPRSERVLRHFIAATTIFLDDPERAVHTAAPEQTLAGAPAPHPAPAAGPPVVRGGMERWAPVDNCVIVTEPVPGRRIEHTTSLDQGQNWSDPRDGGGLRITEEGLQMVAFRSVDDVTGQASEWSTPAQAMIDRSAPSAPRVIQDDTPGRQRLRVVDAIDLHSGVAAIEFRLSADYGQTWSEPQVGDAVDLAADRDRIIQFRAVDGAGNIGEWASALAPAETR